MGPGFSTRRKTAAIRSALRLRFCSAPQKRYLTAYAFTESALCSSRRAWTKPLARRTVSATAQWP